MSQERVIVYPDTPASHAHLLMTEYGFHHLPVVEESTHAPVGMVESRFVMRLLKKDPLLVGRDVVRAKTADKLTHVRSSSVLTAAQLAQPGAPAQRSQCTAKRDGRFDCSAIMSVGGATPWSTAGSIRIRRGGLSWAQRIRICFRSR